MASWEKDCCDRVEENVRTLLLAGGVSFPEHGLPVPHHGIVHLRSVLHDRLAGAHLVGGPAHSEHDEVDKPHDRDGDEAPVVKVHKHQAKHLSEH